MPRGPAERAVIAALHQGKPASRVVADRGDLLLSPGRGRSPRFHANRIACSSSDATGEGRERDSPGIRAFGLGEALGEFIQVTGGDQLPLGGVIAWRHCPVVPGGLAAPDPPPRVLAPQPVQAAGPVVPTTAGGHRW